MKKAKNKTSTDSIETQRERVIWLHRIKDKIVNSQKVERKYVVVNYLKKFHRSLTYHTYEFVKTFVQRTIPRGKSQVPSTKEYNMHANYLKYYHRCPLYQEVFLGLGKSDSIPSIQYNSY